MHVRRTIAEQFFTLDQAMAEIDRFAMAFTSLCEMVYTANKGSYEAEMAFNANKGFRERVRYVLDSLDVVKEEHKRHIERLAPGAVFAKLAE